MKLLIGLGNPGPEYLETPHNAGFLAIDRLAAAAGGIAVTNFRGKAMTGRGRLAGVDVLLVKPATFMNLSGAAAGALLTELGLTPADVLVLYDEQDLPLGQIRLRERGSANGHNGVKSISAVLGTEEWARVKIGVGKPQPESGHPTKTGGAQYLLAPLRKADMALLDDGLDLAVRAVEVALTKGVGAAMNEFNKRVGSE